MIMKYQSNQDRTAEYFKNFDREKILKSLVPEVQPVIFDVGANLGQSLTEFKTIWNDSEIHCFEPQKECWDILDEKQMMYADGKVFINKFAVGKSTENNKNFYSHEVDNTKGTSGFNRINLESLDSIRLNELKTSEVAESDINSYKQTINHSRKVDVKRADDYIADINLKKINLLKIDTQGHEPEVLEGFGASLANVDVIITELMFYDYYEKSLNFSDIEKFLLPAGFQLYDINHIAKNPMNGRTDWVDVIYLNNRCR